MPGLARILKRAFAPRPLEPATICVSGADLAIIFRRNLRARRIIMRLARDGSAAVVTVPRGVSREEALTFVHRSMGWLANQLQKQKTEMADSSLLLLRGEEFRVTYTKERRGLISIDRENGSIHVPGDPVHAKRRLIDWLKREARQALSEASFRHAAAMGLLVRRVTVRDQRSRWGSCSSTGELSYSWRLIMAPPHVLNYVAVHEVAHLRHMNHGPAFWRLVLKHCPDAHLAKEWLKAKGNTLHRLPG
jgi:hypothetical protein